MRFWFAGIIALFVFAPPGVAIEKEPANRASAPDSDQTWALDSASSKQLRHQGGSATEADGVRNKSLVLSGKSLLEVKDSTSFPNSQKRFTLVVWFNPYNLDRGQQMIAAKNRYSLNEREWGVMVDCDQKLRLYVHQGSWKTAQADATLKTGHWHQVGVVVGSGKAELWLNGKLAGTVEVTRPIPPTKAPLTFGGVDDHGRIWQNFQGALDDVMLFHRALNAKEMAAHYKPVKATHAIPDFAKPFSLWDKAAPLPRAVDIPALKDVTFRVIKKWDQKADGFTFLHGVGLSWHKGKLYASIGLNQGAENTVTEEAQYRVSEDKGKTWSELRVIDAGEEQNRLTDQTLYKAVNDFVDPKLRETGRQLADLRAIKDRSSAQEKELAKLTELESELEQFKADLLEIAAFWKPNLNDGVQIIAAPLWKFFRLAKWRNKLKKNWSELESSKYDWAHLALSIWPDRVVREKCTTDRSIAIAHDLEDLLWVEDGKWRRLCEPEDELKNRIGRFSHPKFRIALTQLTKLPQTDQDSPAKQFWGEFDKGSRDGELLAIMFWPERIAKAAWDDPSLAETHGLKLPRSRSQAQRKSFIQRTVFANCAEVTSSLTEAINCVGGTVKQFLECCEEGEFDKARFAIWLWPERVIERATKELGIASAHDIQRFFWTSLFDGAWRPRKSINAEIEEAITRVTQNKPFLQIQPPTTDN